MRYFLRDSFLIALILLSSCNDNTITPTIQFDEPEHILENYFVQSIAFDNEGCAWIGTLNQGLLRFDEKVVHFNSSNSILPDSFTILAMDVDKSGNMWIGSDIGLIKLKNNKFEIFDRSNSPILSNIYSLAVDDENSIWFTNGDIYNGGVIQYDGKSWTYYTPDNSELPSTVVHDITVDKENNKWFTCFGAVVKYNYGKWIVYNSNNSGINLDWGDQITPGNQKDIWVSCDYSLSSITGDFPTVLKLVDNNWSRMEPPIYNNEAAITTDIYGDSKGRIWLARGGELIYYDLGEWNYCCKIPSTIFTIKENRNGQIWLGTGNGIYTTKSP